MESKYNTNESIHKLEIDSEAWKANLRLPKGTEREGGTN